MQHDETAKQTVWVVEVVPNMGVKMSEEDFAQCLHTIMSMSDIILLVYDAFK